MSADPTAGPDAPRTWYPRNLLIWSSAFSLVLVALSVWGWFALDRSIRVQFTWFQIGTLIFFELFMIGLMMGLGTCTVTADRAGLRVRNGIARRTLAWSEIAEIRYRHGDPWAYAIHIDNPDDPSRTMLLGVQSTDGERCRQAVAEIRERWLRHRA
ncbi:PH domain-containing protein [Mariniluteicoccus flavus]